MSIKVAVPTLRGPCYPRCTPTYGQGGSGSRSHRLASGLIPGAPPPLPGNGLLNNLIAYWPGNEVAGNALDAHVNALDLTDINTVTSNPGQVYPLARQYTAANDEYHQHADDPLLSTGNVDFTLAAWCRSDSLAASRTLIGKWAAPANQEYVSLYDNGANRFSFQVTQDGAVGTQTTVAANNFGAPAINTWYLVIVWHDSVGDNIYISINNGAADSAAHVGGVFDSNQWFCLGALDPTPNIPWDGRIGPSMMWKSAAGGGGVLTAAQRTALWNGGAGLTYAEFVA